MMPSTQGLLRTAMTIVIATALLTFAGFGFALWKIAGSIEAARIDRRAVAEEQLRDFTDEVRRDVAQIVRADDLQASLQRREIRRLLRALLIALEIDPSVLPGPVPTSSPPPSDERQRRPQDDDDRSSGNPPRPRPSARPSRSPSPRPTPLACVDTELADLCLNRP